MINLPGVRFQKSSLAICILYWYGNEWNCDHGCFWETHPWLIYQSASPFRENTDSEHKQVMHSLYVLLKHIPTSEDSADSESHHWSLVRFKWMTDCGLTIENRHYSLIYNQPQNRNILCIIIKYHQPSGVGQHKSTSGQIWNNTCPCACDNLYYYALITVAAWLWTSQRFFSACFCMKPLNCTHYTWSVKQRMAV